MSASDYVNLRVEEEAEGVAESLAAKMELAAVGLDVSAVRYPLEKDYRAAYDSAKEAGLSLNGAELEQAAHEAGRAAVLQGFMTGKVRTSKTGELFTDYYQGWWDQAHELAGLVAETR